jgi:Zn-finger nucleic acid-binding protein
MIVECPGCLGRYDVTGRPPGTRARCRCGTIFELPEPPSDAGGLDCPRCGGHVAATNHDCEFCGAPLLVKACPRCFARIFHGARHCTQCGAQVEVPASANPDGSATARGCPRCSIGLMGRLIGDVLLDECPDCHGVFLDVTALERIIKERRAARADAIFGHAGPPGDGPLPQPEGPVYIRCPDCETMMNRKNFAPGSGVIVDVCRAHGTWFDAKELPRVIDFVMDGGLERAQQREIERGKEEVRRQKSAAMAVSHGGAAAHDTRDRVGVFGDLLSMVGDLLVRF